MNFLVSLYDFLMCCRVQWLLMKARFQGEKLTHDDSKQQSSRESAEWPSAPIVRSLFPEERTIEQVCASGQDEDSQLCQRPFIADFSLARSLHGLARDAPPTSSILNDYGDPMVSRMSHDDDSWQELVLGPGDAKRELGG